MPSFPALSPLIWLLIFLALAGHIALWSRVHCFVHSLPWKQTLIDWLELGIILITGIVPIAFVAHFLWGPAIDWNSREIWFQFPLLYFWACWIALVIAFGLWVQHRLDERHAAGYFSSKQIGEAQLTREIPVEHLAVPKVQLANRFPGNQILEYVVTEKELRLPRLPKALDGFTVTHLSDLHLTGEFLPRFYQIAFDAANDLKSEMIVISGDIFDVDSCIEWSESTLGKLSAPEGVYFVLGNHDTRLKNVAPARAELTRLGLVDLGGRWMPKTIRGQTIVLAGDEAPWMSTVQGIDACPTEIDGERLFRFLVAHTPDRFHFARQHDFDLVLAGHNHGGQIRLPVIGPMISPSHYGVRYASGVFYEAPTLMHVSRGLCGTVPLRIRCRPEITRLILRRKA
ncbi:metallophosphoesterase [Blastopirellula sp. JC732]|uniref:Metallophosphoesterase n=1 Tax=Blastopirellula sediminis TaxID=2894196 RepID=A0A9X1MKY5_9BACT|nr:metallophosphoesterase [Blastopirellula sediminis]MCC9607629.1 metallophosphoesterase [Blastopirellula sediminis]MCC9629078.1 metallophosphoesterase [Blastopirellula sediminis]